MKKIILVFCFLFALSALSAVSMSSLTQREMVDFNRSRLSFETKSGTYGYFGDEGFFGEISYRYWVGYQGFERVSEADFFEIAGYKTEAKEARRYHEITWDIFWGGLLSTVAGTVLYYTSGVSDAKEVGGALLIAGGSVALSIAVFRMTTNRYPSNIAQSVADDFNERLIEDITR